MARTISYMFGVLFAILGVWGLISSPALGLFDLSVPHAVASVVVGLLLLSAAAWWPDSAALVLKIFGVIFAVVVLWGLALQGPALGVIDTTGADTVLHAALAVIFLIAGFSNRPATAAAPNVQTPPSAM